MNGTPRTPATAYLNIIIPGCFTLSGFTALVYEVLWTKQLVTVVGTTPFAVYIVLTVFMAGLGLGSFFAGRYIDSAKSRKCLLKAYALLELAIGLYALIIPALIRALTPLFSASYNRLFTNTLLYNQILLLLAALILLPAAGMMGATLPLLVKWHTTNTAHIGRRSGLLYGLNTAGSAIGSLLCGFVFIHHLGMRTTLYAAVLINTFIAAFVFSAARKQSCFAGPLVTQNKQASSAAISRDAIVAGRCAVFIFAVSGFCAMAYETLWMRLLSLIIGPTTYSFTIVLFIFITGLGLGGMLSGWLADRLKSAMTMLLATQFLAAASALVVSHLLGNSQLFFTKIIYHFNHSFFLLTLIKAGALFILMAVPTICLGAAFPAVAKLVSEKLSGIGNAVGKAYAYNSAGAVAGTFCAAFILIPLLGKQRSISLVVLFQIVAAAAVLVIVSRTVRNKRYIPGLIGAIACAIALCMHLPRWHPELLATGKYHRFEAMGISPAAYRWLESAMRGTSILRRYGDDAKMVFHGDGPGGFTTVFEKENALGRKHHILYISGKADASSSGDMSTQTLSAHIPIMFHEQADTVMVLGLASGVTAGEALLYPVKKLDVVEISKDVVKASSYFNAVNGRPLDDRRTELIVQDARAHLKLTERRYDVIISEPSNPWMAGIAGLYTTDFYRLVRSRLKKNGIFAQFLHSYQIDWETFSMAGRSFARVFEHGALMKISPMPALNTSRGGDYLLIGFASDTHLRLQQAQKNIQYTIKSKNAVVHDAKILLQLLVTEDLHNMFGSGPVHTDNKPLLEYAAPRRMHASSNTIDKEIVSRRSLRSETIQQLKEFAGNAPLQLAFARLAFSVGLPVSGMLDSSLAAPSQKKEFAQIIDDYCREHALKNVPFSRKDYSQQCCAAQIEALRNAQKDVSNKAVLLNQMGNIWYFLGEIDSALHYYKTAGSVPGAHEMQKAFSYNNCGLAYRKKGDLKNAVALFRKAVGVNKSYAVAYYNLGCALQDSKRQSEAKQAFMKAIYLKPHYTKAHIQLARLLESEGNVEEALKYYRKALSGGRGTADMCLHAGVLLLNTGSIDSAIEYLSRAVRLNAAMAAAYVSLAAALGQKGDINASIGHLRTAISLDSTSVEAFTNYGAALIEQKQFGEAIRHLRKAVALDSGYARAHNNLAVAYFRNGSYQKAIQHADAAVRLGWQVHPRFMGDLEWHRNRRNTSAN